MKNVEESKAQRRYEQTARAEAAAATGSAIVESFMKRLETQWFEDITLESVAQDAGVTVQTVIRRFGGKAGVLAAAIENLDQSIEVRREIRPGDVEFSVEVLSKDYEAAGDLVVKLLEQEERHDVIKPFVDQGRKGHRDWLEKVFSAELKPLASSKRREKLDALVVATDLYVWKLLRRDMGRSVATFKRTARCMLQAALDCG